MSRSHADRRHPLAPKPLAACLALVLAGSGMALAPAVDAALPGALRVDLASRPVPGTLLRQLREQPIRTHVRSHAERPDRPATTLVVTSCDDNDDPGTLRNTVADAISGDTVDLSSLACSTITLEQGAIVFDVDDLRFQGRAGLAIDGAATDSVLVHYGEGTLSLDQLTITNGYFEGGGGCIFSYNNVSLSHSTVSGCSTSNDYGAGAGILALGDLTLESSTLSGNTGALLGGGAVADGTMRIVNSTISGNSAQIWGGGLYGAGPVSIANSTITGNQAEFGGGGIFLPYPMPTTLASTIVAGNTSGDGAYYAADIAAGYPMTIAGSHNLVISSDASLPADTLDADPMLLPLADNGGPTQTHALAAGSPAIDAGNNERNLEFDQRGPGYLRDAGAAPDIGAFELQGSTDDTIFRDGFDGSGVP